MPATFLLMKNNRSRLILQTELVFNIRDRCFEDTDRDAFGLGRIETERKQKLFAPCATAYRIGFIEGPMKIIG